MKRLIEKAYVTPKKFADCIDTIFSANVGKIKQRFGTGISDRDDITVDMFMEWLREEGSRYAESVGFINCFYENSGKIQELIVDLETEVQRLEKIAATEADNTEHLKAMVALECYSTVLSQLNNYIMVS